MIKGKEKFNPTARPDALPTGLFDCTPVAVNPTLEELKKLGVNLKNEPDYTTKHYVHKYEGRNIVVWMKYKFGEGENEQTFINPTYISVYKEYEQPSKATATTKIINSKMDSTWVSVHGKSAAEIEAAIEERNQGRKRAYVKKGAKALREGEHQLYDFITKLSGLLPSDDDFEFTPLTDKEWEKLVDGDVTKIRKVILGSNGTVRMLRGINRENKRGNFFEKFSRIGDSCYLYAGQKVREKDDFYRHVLDMNKKSKEDPDPEEPGEWSWSNSFIFNFEADMTKVPSMPDITKLTEKPAENLDESDFPL